MHCVNQAPLPFNFVLEWPTEGTKRSLRRKRVWSVYFFGPFSLCLSEATAPVEGPFLVTFSCFQ